MGSSLLDRFRRRDVELPRPNEAQRAATYPDPYPAGWYRLCDADQLARGEVQYHQVLGEHLALFRSDQDGQLGVVDAHCPHQGANLAGGVVRDGHLLCPFHHWAFGRDGKVENIPYSALRKATLCTRSWPVQEHAGMVLFYFEPGRPERDSELVPPYRVAQSERLDEMKLRGHHDAGEVRMHLIEFAENSVDFAHFTPVHGEMLVPWTKWKVPFIEIDHQASWESDPERPHMAYFHDHATLQFRGTPMPSTTTQATISFHGPGGLVDFRFHLRDLGDIVLFQSHTPLEPLRLKVDFRWFADPQIPRPLVSYVVGSWITQWSADISIWENKVYRPRPMLVAEDGPVHEMRRWFRQFYPSKRNGSGDAVGIPSGERPRS